MQGPLVPYRQSESLHIGVVVAVEVAVLVGVVERDVVAVLVLEFVTDDVAVEVTVV